MTPLRVLDVSRWQGRIDWDTVQRSGTIDGVMLRVLGSRNGQPYPDPQFERNHAACTARGIPVGGYYYTCAVTSRQTEAELNALRAALRGKTFQLPPRDVAVHQHRPCGGHRRPCRSEPRLQGLPRPLPPRGAWPLLRLSPAHHPERKEFL